MRGAKGINQRLKMKILLKARLKTKENIWNESRETTYRDRNGKYQPEKVVTAIV
jgi:hypothetical protein